MKRFEAKVKKTIESREFVGKFDNTSVTLNNVNISDNVVLGGTSGSIVDDVTKNWIGNFSIDGELTESNDNRVLNINVSYPIAKEIIANIFEMIDTIQNSDYDIVTEYTHERLAREAHEAALAEAARLAEEEAARLAAAEEERLRQHEAWVKQETERLEQERLEAEKEAAEKGEIGVMGKLEDLTNDETSEDLTSDDAPVDETLPVEPEVVEE